MDEKELQTKYMQTQALKRNLDKGIEEQKMIEQGINELKKTKKTLAGIKDINKSDEVWVPIGSGSYIKTDITNVDEVVIGLGANTLGMKGLDEAKEILEKRKKRLDNMNEMFSKKLGEINKRYQALQKELQKAVAEREKKKTSAE